MAEQRPSLPRLDTNVLHDEPASERLIIAVAQTLDIPRGDILLFDSFTDLGGDDLAAEALRVACRRKGIEAKADDIMGCHTLAELQTRITPFPPRLPLTPAHLDASTAATSEEEDGSGPSSLSASVDDMFSPTNRDSVSSYGSLTTSSSSNDSCAATRPTGQDLESLLKSSPRVRNVCLVTPRAGPFDGQLVALVSISDSNALPAKKSGDTSLAPRSEHAMQKKQIRSLRIAVQEWGADSRRPQIWIPLLSMAEHEDGRPNTRALQTWAQNINEAVYEEIMKLQIPEPRRRGMSPMSRQRQVKSWAESRRSIWRDDDQFDCDEMECFSLAPMQQLYFQTSLRHVQESETIVEPEYRHTQSILLRIKGGADDSDIEAAVEAVVARHAMLRARFRPVPDDWVQVVIPQASNSYRFGHHTDVDDEEMVALIETAQETINPTDGPVFAVEHVKNDNEQTLYLTAHHLVVDLISWRIIVHDLDELLHEGTLLSEGSIPFPHWIDYQSYEMSQRLFEPTLPFGILPADLDYWNLRQDSNCHGSTEKSSFSLSAELSSTLQKACTDVLRTDAADVFLAALLLSFRQTFSDRSPPTLWKREHGREVLHEDYNIMETVGWFTSLCPVGVGLDATTDLIQAIKLMKDTRRAIPRDGIPFFASEFSTVGGACGIPVEVILNWVDTLQQIQRPNGILQPIPVPGQVAGTLRSDVGPKVGRMALFEVSAMIDDSGARVEFTYNKNASHQSRIRTWVQTFEHLVLEAIGRLRCHEPELTLSDVPLLRTSYKALARLGADRLVGSGLPSSKDVETIYPVTPAQQEILMCQSQSAENFHVRGVYQLRSPHGSAFDATRLCKAWESIVASKPALRSIFIDSVSREGLFDQVVLRKTSPSMLFIESSRPEEALSRVPALNTPLTEPRHRLSVCHTWEKTLVRVDISQAICDLMSVHNLMAELCSVYAGQTPSHNESLHRTYLYHVSSLDTSYSLEVWKADLAGAKPCLFPQLSPEPEAKTQPFDLEVTREQLTACCQELKVDPAAILQLAWALVLRAFVGMDRVTFGYQYAGRDEELLQGIGKAVGSFASILPCSIDAAPNQSIKKCLTAVQEAFANAQKHQSLTMAEIQHALRLRERELFNTCFFLEDSDVFADEDDVDLSELAPSLVTSARQTDCQLSLTATFTGNHLHANLSSSFLSNNQVQSVMHSFERAVKNIIDHPARLVAEVDLFTDRDYAQLVVQDWEASQRSQKVSACLHDVILRHSQTRPHAQAVCSWDGDLTYIQLATLVTRLRTYLVNLGVGPGMIVPVILEKSRWAPVMLLAVMQAGASFVALDYQDQLTVRSTINYLNPHIVLATETAWKELGSVVMNLVIINNAFFVMLPPHMSALARESTPEHAACVFVTPKRTSSGASRSIFFTHASLCSAFAGQGPALKIDSESRVLQLSAFNVDISLVEILGTMVHGGCVCIPSAHDRVHDLSGVMARMGVTWTYMTSVLARRIKPETVPALKTLCFRTRKLDPDTYGPWLENRNVLLAYGAPDVCPLGISVTAVTNGKDLSVISPPVAGRFWILNPEDPRKLMPVGAIGELAIDSPTVTPHRFAPDLPLVAPSPRHSSDKQKARYLKTGHRVRYLDDGNVQFISSVRDEVVVDGSSVDIADVEQRIRRCLGPGVDVVVDKIATKDSIRVLAAFVELGDTLFDGQEGFEKVSPRVKERTFIAKKLFEASLETPQARAARLPEHYIPAIFIPLKDFPMSTSLKINRRKLLRIAAGHSYSELLDMSNVPNPKEIQRGILNQKPLPLTRPEEIMRAIWARVLSVSPDDIKGTSTFLSAGGNKFLASELVVSCRRVGLRVSLTDIFREATLTEVCRSASLDPKREKTKALRMVASMKDFNYSFVKSVIAPKLQCSVQDVLDVADASSEQVRNLELGMYAARADIVCLVLNFNGSVRAEKLQSACEALAKLHPVLQTAFFIHEHQVCQVLCSSFKPAFNKFTCPSSRLDSATEKLVKQDQDVEFQPTVPVTGFSYIDAGEQSTLVVRLSKAQVDDASAPLLVQDLTALYEAKDVPTASSFFEYTRAAKANHLEGIAYWTEQLDGAKMTEVISHSKPYGMASQVKSVQESVKINMLGDHGMAPDTIIKAAWATVLATISGMSDVLFGETIQGHNVRLPDNASLSSMVGPLTNTIPVRVRFPSGHKTPLYLMKQIQRQRRSNCIYESFGIQEIAQKCTNWPSWKRFSTIVQHRATTVTDGSATLNIGSTTFTYKTIESKAHDLPDLLVCSTMETSERMGLEIKFSEDRVSHAFAEECMRLLVAALETLTHRDTVDQPMLQSAEEIERSEKRIPFATQDHAVLRIPLDQLLLPEQRGHLEAAVSAAWNEALESKSQDKLQQGAAFYTDGSSLLPAHPIAKHLNQKLPNVDIKGIGAVTFTPEDVIDNPTMLAQLEFIVRRLREGGALSLPLPRKTMSFRADPSAPAATSAQRPNSAQPLTWRNSIRILRGRESYGSMRGLSIKTPSWKKHKEHKDEASPTSDGPLASPVSAPRTPMSSVRESAIPELMDLSSLSGLFAGRNSGGSDKIIETIIEEGDEKLPTEQGRMSPFSPTSNGKQKSIWGAFYNGRESLAGGRISSK
ncbi:Nonribosomal peptide synthetase 12 [Neonectria ditissima]|uniref:Nonribosomal peptide synthetase 12 n=1 Tax=Neonectria ditissima TaxID=78410 RepID=A0A0P7ACV8_9HYPO|nr:Nonribosomal peptide synthetase 12 [Neonectria ditissima]